MIQRSPATQAVAPAPSRRSATQAAAGAPVAYPLDLRDARWRSLNSGQHS